MDRRKLDPRGIEIFRIDVIENWVGIYDGSNYGNLAENHLNLNFEL